MSTADVDGSTDAHLSHLSQPARQSAPKVYTPHPLFPRDDGTPEDEDIQFVSFVRRAPDGSVKHSSMDFPAEEMLLWEQVTDLWGGGDYQAVAKDRNHHVIRHCPVGNKWQSFDDEPRPMVKPKRQGAPTAQASRPPDVLPAAAAPAAVAVAPPGMAEVLGSIAELARDLRQMKAPHSPQGGSNDVVLAMLSNQQAQIKADAEVRAAQVAADAEVKAAQIKAQADQHAAQAKLDADARAAQAQATTENNKFLLGLMTRGGGSEEKLANLLALMKPYLQPPRAAQERDVLGILREAKELFPQAGPAPGSEIKPIADMFGGIMTQSLAADAKKVEAAAELRKAEIQAARVPEVPSQRRDREPPPLVHVLGLGLVHVVAPEATLTHAPGPAAPAGQAPAAPAAQAPAAPAAQAPAAPAAQAPAAPAAQAPAAPAAQALAAPAAEAPAAPAAEAPAPPAAEALAPAVAAPAAAPAPSPAPCASPIAPDISEAPVAPAAAMDPPPPSAEQVAAASVSATEPPHGVLTTTAPPVVAAPEPAVEMPAEFRAVLQQAARDVTDDDRALITGTLGSMHTKTLAERASLLQGIFPLMSAKEVAGCAEMMIHLPILQIHQMVSQLQPADVANAKRAIEHLSVPQSPDG